MIGDYDDQWSDAIKALDKLGKTYLAAPKAIQKWTLPVVGVSFVDGYPANLMALNEADVQADDAGGHLAVVLRRNPSNTHDANAIEVHVSRLRAKIEPAGVHIRTVRGFGYLCESGDG